MHTNKQRYIDQMINRDVVEKVHKRMHDELVAITKSDFAESEGGFPLERPLMSIPTLLPVGTGVASLRISHKCSTFHSFSGSLRMHLIPPLR